MHALFSSPVPLLMTQPTSALRFCSRLALARKPSAIRELHPLLSIPGMISLGGGMPNPATFPITGLRVTLRDGSEIDVPQEGVVQSLQYGATSGLPPMTAWIRGLMARYHKETDAAVCVTTGSQDGIVKALEMVLGPGSTLLVEDPTYSGTLAFTGPLQASTLGVESDAGGLVPAALDRTLDAWDADHPGCEKPRCLYLIPNGQNPSGTSLDEPRRRAILDVARKHDLLILEDDPYYFLQFCPQDQVAKSFLELDEDGRVLRFDSLSKILSSGMRIGWVSGPPELVERIQLHNQAAVICPSGLSQTVAAAILNEWGEQGWDAHVATVAAFYKRRRDLFLAAAERHLTGLAEWTSPEAGMFVWFRLVGIDDSRALIQNEARDAKVLLVPGQAFSPSDSPGPFVRAAFSIVEEDQMDEAVSRLAQVLKAAKA